PPSTAAGPKVGPIIKIDRCPGDFPGQTRDACRHAPAAVAERGFNMHRRWLVSGMAALALTAAGAGVSARQLASRPVDDWSARLQRAGPNAALRIHSTHSS